MDSPQLETKHVRIFLVDDHSFILEGLKSLISSKQELKLVGAMVDCPEAVSAILEIKPDIVVMDISMPGLGGIDATRQIRQACPAIKVLALSMHEDISYLRGILAAGASGYVIKRSAPQELINAIMHIHAGGTYIDPAIAAKVTSIFIAAPKQSEDDKIISLSEREESVIRLVAKGYTGREIASQLDLSVKTAESYKARAMEKIGIEGRAALVRYAAVHGWFETSST